MSFEDDRYITVEIDCPVYVDNALVVEFDHETNNTEAGTNDPNAIKRPTTKFF